MKLPLLLLLHSAAHLHRFRDAAGKGAPPPHLSSLINCECKRQAKSADPEPYSPVLVCMIICIATMPSYLPKHQVKLTAEPKKHALELLRSKIEAQNAKVSAVRRRYDAAKKVCAHVAKTPGDAY